MRGYKITCTASSYSDGGFKAVKGWTTEVPENDPLVARVTGCPAFKVVPCEVPDVFEESEPGKPADKKLDGGNSEDGSGKKDEPHTENDDIVTVSGIPANLHQGLKEKGYDTVAKVLAAGVDKLDEVQGIGIPMANQILLACQEHLGA